MSRKTRMSDIVAASSWHFGVGLDERPATRRVIQARRCAYAACQAEGFSLLEIANFFKKHRTTVVHALSQGTLKESRVDPEDVAAVLKNAKLRAMADHEVLA